MNGRLYAVLSRKGGVGKSTLVAALGARWALAGKRVVLVDMSTGMRCLDMLFGLESRIGFDLGDVLESTCGLDRALVVDRSTGVRLLSARQFDEGTPINERTLRIILEVLSMQNDYVILDTPGGIAYEQTLAAAIASQTLLVSTPDDASMRDAERLATLLRSPNGPLLSLVINRIDPILVEEGLQFAPEICAQVLDLPILGVIPEDSAAHRHALSKDPSLGDTVAAQSIDNIRARLMDDTTPLLHCWKNTLPARTQAVASPPTSSRKDTPPLTPDLPTAQSTSDSGPHSTPHVPENTHTQAPPMQKRRLFFWRRRET